MKKIIIIALLVFAAPLAGCSMLKQSNRTHHAIEDKTDFDVDKVVVKVHNGDKSVIVHLFKKASAEDIEAIKGIVLEQVPDAQDIVIKAK